MTTCTETYRPSAMWGRPGDSIPCHREVDATGRHTGKHQAFEHIPPHPGDPDALFRPAREPRPAWRRLWSWSEGGAQGTSNYDKPGANCSACGPNARRPTHQPTDHGYSECDTCGALHDHYRGQTCETCVYWLHRVAAYAGEVPADPRKPGALFVRVHPDSPSMSPTRFYAWSPGHGGAFGGLHVTVKLDDGRTLGPADCLWDNGEIPWWLLDRFPANARVSAGDKVPRAGYTDASGRPLDYTAHPPVQTDARPS